VVSSEIDFDVLRKKEKRKKKKKYIEQRIKINNKLDKPKII